MLAALALIVLSLIAVLVVWRLHRAPIGGDVQLQLLWRGAAAGTAGGLTGAALSYFFYGVEGYWPVGYFYWLIVTAILGMAFTYLVGAIQMAGLTLNLPARAVVGGVVGIIAAWVWASVIRADSPGKGSWFVKGIICMIVGAGIASGILGGPVRRDPRGEVTDD